jgi:predicted dehydrogenase
VKRVRLGIIGVGNMGSGHAAGVLEGHVKRCDLAAVCDIDPERIKGFDDPVKTFVDHRKMFAARVVDAVLIATPHYSHTTIGIDALKAGLHVLVEKPISAHKADCERLIAAHRKRKQVFAAMFNQRTDPHYGKAKELVKNGDLGDLVRVTWLNTPWFRTQHYYSSGTWRATWAGEGGGVLLNQAPHQLDLLQWICGMPTRVWGFCGLGKRHRIEVEDEVTAYMEYRNGATGVFTTSTGESPGTNRLEIAGDKAKLVVEGDKLLLIQNEMPAGRFSRTVKELFAAPHFESIEIEVDGCGGQHNEIRQNFVDAILDGAKLIAPAREGIHSVELANAMLFSSLTGKPVDLPMNGKAYERRLKRLIKESKVVKKAVKRKKAEKVDMSKSFK